MQRCVALASRGRGRTAPNPMVGAVVVRDGVILAEGWHRAPGMAHAEVDAIQNLDGSAEGATMYVNLEPCRHHGRTPPCTDSIIAAGLKKVVVGQVDPDDRMQGKGIEQLRAAGIEVEVGVELNTCRELNHAYLSARERGRPWVTVKAAITLDGRIADNDGQSQWITGEAARAVGHRMRDEHDAIMIGAGTLQADDPSLNTRFDGGRDALPVILDTELGCAADAKVLKAGRQPVIYCAEGVADRDDLAAEVVPVPRNEQGWLDLTAVLADLERRGVHSVLVEGGGKVIRSLMDLGCVDRIDLFIAGKILAGGPGWMGGTPYSLAEAPSFEVVCSEAVGKDLHLILEHAPCSAES
jgi:diaminohydroxyphosphoribosylaminopyrimidine deaminase/5-amino-6-(5-phosphoribosylamino)uracil reductase